MILKYVQSGDNMCGIWANRTGMLRSDNRDFLEMSYLHGQHKKTIQNFSILTKTHVLGSFTEEGCN